MNWEAIGTVSEVVGALAVLVTLFYLAKQIRHSSESQDRANQIAQAESVTNSNALFLTGWEQIASNEELAAIYDRALSGQELSSVESVRFVAFLYMYFAWMEVLYCQISVDLGFQDMGPKEYFDISKTYVSKLLSTQVGAEWWNSDARSNFSTEFYDDVSAFHNT